MNKIKVYDEETILNELNLILGTANATETILDYAKYAEIKQEDEIENNLSNFNMLIKCTNEFDNTLNLVDLINNILKYNNIVDTDNYYEISHQDIRQNNFANINEKVIVVGTKTNLWLRGAIEFMTDIMKQYDDKIYIFVLRNPREEVIKRHRLREDTFSDFLWTIELGDASLEEKQNYIFLRLKKHKISVSKSCCLISELAKQDIHLIDKELLYILVKSKCNKVKNITNDFLKQIHREQYITKFSNISAMQELNELIGLDDIKKQIKQIVNYIKVNKSRNQLPMLHLCFLGPAGSGKSEVAR